MSKGWIGVDLDGTLAKYDGWHGIAHIGEPIPEMVSRVKTWLAAGEDVRIFTARVDGGEVAIAAGNDAGIEVRDVERTKGYIKAWCISHIGQELPITNVKDYGMKSLWDDRAVGVEANTGRVIWPNKKQTSPRRPITFPEVINKMLRPSVLAGWLFMYLWGMVLANGFWSTLFAIFTGGLWSAYLVVEKITGA